ncbi:PKD domain-containing protein [Rufibacter glacialis]|uniref:PKD domain-containing protein n=1 Tax=Rufibacter glacialis TaxID=1259555 RepID=A0A5M8QHV0_9BACT|nr:PKD domain-containing protein [Rufibacter glacialis]KAA6434366.1 PKD domain-containing protein [Rufibacter glacialis]GGK68879.1 hypothetical protein GCM10011405_16280 [Rufibacter glacialis]
MKIIKNYVLLICLFSWVFSFCKDQDEEVLPKNAHFIVQKDSNYLHNDFEFEAIDSLPNIKYKWNFGDGSLLETGHKVSHKYKTPGTYTVSLTLGNVTSSKEVLVYPGTLSYQIKNESKNVLHLETYVDNLRDNGSVVFTLGAGRTSDQIFSKTIFVGGVNARGLLGVFLTYNNIKYIYRPSIWLELFQNHTFVLTNSTEFHRVSSNDIGPERIRLENL